MDKNLDSYIKVYKGMLAENICAETVKTLANSQWTTHTYRDLEGTYISYDKELDVSWDSVPTRQQIMDTFWQAINTYINEDLKLSWFSGWQGFSGVRFNKYDVNTQMREHCDHIHDIFDGQLKGIPTLSVLCGLNNEYEGGELIFFEDKQYELKAGDIMVFPSCFLYPHKVQEVTSGTRYSCVSWVY
jgi:predicted 2-oxoglutarate/Fe(II)-dependent dioxygenase YbiX